MQNKAVLIGFDIGGTKVAVSLGDFTGKIYGGARIENNDSYPEEVIPQMISEAKRLVSEHGFTMADVAAAGISSPGSADYRNGIMTHPTNNKYWRNVPIRQLIADGLGCPAYFENDANCAMLAEWFFGAAKGAQDAIYLTMSTGIGAGIIAAGHLVCGKSGQTGEVGHMVLVPGGLQCNCGLRGCYETYCAGKGLAQRMAAELADKPDSMLMQLADGDASKLDMHLLEKAVRAGDLYAVNLWDETSRLHAQAIGILINSLNPEKIVLGTFAWAIGDLFMDPILKYLPEFAWKELMEVCEIVPGKLQREIGNYAGIAAALNGLYEAGKFSFDQLK